jgi:hypothetical protein
MRLSAKPIISYCNVNNYSFGNQWIVRAGDPNTLYFQILDIDQAVNVNNTSNFGVFTGITPVNPSAGLRYMLGIGSQNQPYGITVTFPSLDNSKTIVATAVQADANDSSIWKVSLSSLQSPGGGNVQFAIMEGSVVRRFSVMNMIGVDDPTNDGSC